MPQLPRSEWYDLTRDMNWTLSHVTEEEAFPTELSNTYGVPHEAFWAGMNPTR